MSVQIGKYVIRSNSPPEAPPEVDLQELSRLAGVTFGTKHLADLQVIAEWAWVSPELRKQSSSVGYKRKLTAIRTRARQLLELLEETFQQPDRNGWIVEPPLMSEYTMPLTELITLITKMGGDVVDGRHQYTEALRICVQMTDAVWKHAGGRGLGIYKKSDGKSYGGSLLRLLRKLFEYGGVKPQPSGSAIWRAATHNARTPPDRAAAAHS